MLEFSPAGEFLIQNETKKVYVIDPIPNELVARDILRIMREKEQVTISGESYYIVGVEALRHEDTRCGILVDKNRPE